MTDTAISRIIDVNGKTAKTYDNLFTFDERRLFYNFALGSYYKMIGNDGIATASENNQYQISSKYDQNDVLAMGFFVGENINKVLKDNGCSLDRVKQCRVNCSHLGEKNVVHSDGKGKTLLYCLNINWRPQWGGHLMLMNEDATDPLEIIGYVSGRVSVFDGDIPHCVMTPTVMSPFHRLTLAVQFNDVH